jgi:hypothetical protein
MRETASFGGSPVCIHMDWVWVGAGAGVCMGLLFCLGMCVDMCVCIYGHLCVHVYE